MGSKIRYPVIFKPRDTPLTEAEQKAQTAFDAVVAMGITGMLPLAISDLFGNPGQRYYFQRDAGKICLTRFNNGPYLKTPARLAQEDKMRQAVSAWKELSEEEKEGWYKNKNAQDRQLPGYQYFLSEFLKGKI